MLHGRHVVLVKILRTVLTGMTLGFAYLSGYAFSADLLVEGISFTMLSAVTAIVLWMTFLTRQIRYIYRDR